MLEHSFPGVRFHPDIWCNHTHHDSHPDTLTKHVVHVGVHGHTHSRKYDWLQSWQITLHSLIMTTHTANNRRLRIECIETFVLRTWCLSLPLRLMLLSPLASSIRECWWWWWCWWTLQLCLGGIDVVVPMEPWNTFLGIHIEWIICDPSPMLWHTG